MLYREIITVCSEIHTKHINSLCGKNVELLNVKPVGKYSDHWAQWIVQRAWELAATRRLSASPESTASYRSNIFGIY